MRPSSTRSLVVSLALSCAGSSACAVHGGNQVRAEIVVDGSALDDGPALQAALDRAGTGPAVVRLPPGRYDFYPPLPLRDSWLRLGPARDIEIAGEGAELVLHDFDPNAAPGEAGAYPAHFLSCDHVNGLELHGLELEMTREPYSSGIATAKSGAGELLPWIELELEQDYPDLRSGFQLERVDDFDPASRRLKSMNFDAALQAGEYEVTLTRRARALPIVRLAATRAAGSWFRGRLSSVPLGDGLVLMHSKYRSNFLFVQRSTGLSVHDLTLHDMPGMGVLAYDTSAIALERYTVAPQAERLLSTTADAIHLQDCTGAVLVKDCHVRASGDDGLNTHGKFLLVSAVQALGGGANRVYLDEVPGQPYFDLAWGPGTLEFFSPELAGRGMAQMSAFSLSARPDLGKYAATFDAGLPFAVASGDLVGNRSKLPDSVTIETSSVEDNIGRGLALHGPHLFVHDCTFRRNTDPAIMLEGELVRYFETTPGDGLVITGCTIDDADRFTWDLLGAITVLGEYPDGSGGALLAAAGLHRRIRIEGNTFQNLAYAGTSSRGPRAALWITAADDVEVQGNTFEDLAPDVRASSFQNCTNVSCAPGD